MAKPKAVIFDIDSTLSSTAHRERYLEEKPPDWSGFHGAMVLDAPLMHTVRKLQEHRDRGDKIILLSMRPERFRRYTERWLDSMGIKYKEMFLRPENEYIRGVDAKLRIYKEQIEPKYDVIAAYDDRQDIVEMWEAAGVRGRLVTDPGLPPLEGMPVPDPKYPAGRPEWKPTSKAGRVPTSGAGGIGRRGQTVYVPPHERVQNGQLVHVDGYFRELSAVERLKELVKGS